MTRPRIVPIALLVALASCQTILDIEDAEVDPALDGSEEQPAQVGGSGGSTDPAGTVCERYCETVTQTCTGAFAQYTTYANCLSVCELLPPGSPGDDSGNSAQCRLQAAGQAPLEPSYYCPAAGPGGNGVCGSNCEAVCALLGSLCEADDDVEDCAKSCAEVEDKQTYSVAPDLGLFEGKHVQCRLYHATVAAETDTEQHCQHALGSSPCDP